MSTNLIERRKQQIRNRLEREMKRLAIDVIVKKEKFKSDGCNGFVYDGTEEYKLTGIIKNCNELKSKDFFLTITDAGRTYNITDLFSVVYNPDLNIEMYDKFEVDGKTFTILDCQNAGMQDVYFILGLTTEKIEVSRYGNS